MLLWSREGGTDSHTTYSDVDSMAASCVCFLPTAQVIISLTVVMTGTDCSVTVTC